MRLLVLILLLLAAAMGSAASVPFCLFDNGPKSIYECIGVDGWIDPEVYLSYQRRNHDKTSMFLHSCDYDGDEYGC